jgi:diaminopimelate decarboxylase
MEKLCAQASDCGARIEVISAGGGLPIPYREGEPRLDVQRYRAAWLETRQRIAARVGNAVSLEVEPGRYLVAECGLLLTEVRGTKRSGSYRYAIVDAGFHNLIRPAMYGAYHQITALGQTGQSATSPQVVAGPLCESGDVFTVDSLGHLLPQALPELGCGDLLCIHDAGAYGASMSSTYNAQPLALEVLVDP